MAQRVRKPYRGPCDPSSATQLPILTALHAGLPTLFENNIQDDSEKVKRKIKKITIFFIQTRIRARKRI